MIETVSRAVTFVALIGYARTASSPDISRATLGLTILVAIAGVAVWGTDRSAFLYNSQEMIAEITRLRAQVLAAVQVPALLVCILARMPEVYPAVAVICVGVVLDVEYVYRSRSRYFSAGLPRLISSLSLFTALLVLGLKPAYGLMIYALGYLVVAGALRRRAPVPTTHSQDDAAGPSALRKQVLMLGLTALSGPILYFADQVFIARLDGLASLADYSLAYRLLLPLLAAYALSQSVWVPRLPQGQTAYHDYQRFNRRLLVVLLPVCVLLATASIVWLGERGASVSQLLVLLAIQVPLVAESDPPSRWLSLKGHASTLARIEGLVVAITMVAFSLLIPAFGVGGAIAGTLLAQTAYLILVRLAFARADGPAAVVQ